MLKPNNRSVGVVHHAISCGAYYIYRPHVVKCISCIGGNILQLVLVVSILYYYEAGCCDVYLCSAGCCGV